MYDFAGRLTRVDDTTAAETGISLGPDVGPTEQAPCTRREYVFDKNGNRISAKTRAHAGGDCFYSGGQSTTSYTYDALDRPVTAGDGSNYIYDAFGRQKTIPAADAPNPDAGDIGVTYFDDDQAASITQGSLTTMFGMDVTGRRLTQSTTNGGVTTSVSRHYGDESDIPAWTVDQSGKVTRATASLDGTLGGLIDGDGNTALTLANPHGDNVTTISIPANQPGTVAATSISGWVDYTEYGTSKTGHTTGVGYGWLGKHERYTNAETAGLTLMGVRLYNPTRGAFTTTDPVAGGNTTAYTYPQDPIDSMDLDGRMAVVAVAGLVGGVSAGTVLIAVGWTVVAGIAAVVIWKGTAWAKKKITTLYNEAKEKKKKKTTKKSGKESSSDVPSYAKGARIEPGEDREEAIKRIMGSRYPKSKKDTQQKTEYGQIKKRLDRR